MSTLLLVHRGEVALERDVAAALAASMRALGHDVRCTWEQRGVAGGQLCALETAVAAVDSVLLVDPHGWWMQGPVDEWQRSLWSLVDYTVWAPADRFALAIVGPATGQLEPLLERLPSFALPQEQGTLLEWLARPRAEFVLPTIESLPRVPGHVRPGDPALVAIDKAVARGDLVWIRGATGTGKSTLLAEWLHQRGPKDVVPICHVARPGIAWSHDPEQVLAKLVRALLGEQFVGSPAEALARLDQRSERALVVIDGLEQIASTFATLDDERRERLRSVFAGKTIPRGVTVVVASRALAFDLGRAPTIDLDAEPWRARRLERAEPVRATSDPDAEVPPLPSELASALERSWTAMLARTERARLRSALSVLAAARESLPTSLWHAALSEEERAVLHAEASEWLHDEDGRVGFVHPFVRQFLEPELDLFDPAPHVRLLDAIASLQARGLMDPAATAYANQHLREHRVACHGFDAALAWVLDVELLAAMAQRGALVGRLEAALELADPERRPLVEHTLAVARRHYGELVEKPDHLASHLWTELVGAGMPAAEVVELLNWGAMLPSVRLLNAMNYRERSHLRLAHDSDVRGCAINAEATRAISVTTGRHLHVWSVRTGEQLAKLDVGAWAESCAISSDGARGVVGAARRVSLWNLDTHTELHHHEDHRADVTTVSMSADGKLVVSADRDGTVLLWEIEGGRIWLLGRHNSVVRCSAISGDGRLAMTGDDDRRVSVWSIERRDKLHNLAGHTYGVGGVALTWAGDLGVSVCIGEARVWDPQTGRLIDTFGELGKSAHGCVLVAGAEGVGWEALVPESGQDLHRWTVADGQLRTRHLAHAQDMTCVAATPDGKWYMTGGQDHLARIWESARVTGIDEYPYARAITALCASADGTSVWVSGGSGGTRRVSVVDGREIMRIDSEAAHGIVEAGDRVVTVGSGRTVEVHVPSKLTQIASWEPTKDWLRTCAVDPSRSRLAYAGDEKVVLISGFDGKDVVRLEGPTDWVRAVAWTAEGRVVSVDDDGQLRVWDVDAKSCTLQCEPLDKYALYALVVDGGRAFVGGVGGKIASVDLRTGNKLVTFDAHETAVTDLALAERGTLVSVGRDATVRIWSVDDTDSRMLVSYEGVYPFTRVAAAGRKIVAGDAAGNYLILEVEWERLLDA